MARLRAPDGCPWDQEQTHATLVRCLIDEVSELIDTIDRGDYPHMREELGDVLIQVVFHAQIASERGEFNFDDVARDINDKLVRRHPHVFGAGKLDTSEQVIAEWEKIKATDQGDYFRVPLDARSLDYSKYVEDGEDGTVTAEDYDSDNTERLDVEQTKALVAALPEMQAVLEARR